MRHGTTKRAAHRDKTSALTKSAKTRIKTRSKSTPSVTDLSSGADAILGPGAETISPLSKRTVAQAWTPILVRKGFVGISRIFLRHYAKLNPPITHGEAMFITHLMDYKWDAQAPFPGYKTIASFMGVTVKQARRLAKSLDDKKYLRREIRESTTNRFYLDGLFKALEKRVI
jgi:hypothetical protein